MAVGVTTSIRLVPELRKKLEKVSHALHRGKNWIIAQALEDYFAKLNHNGLAEEALRQSRLATKHDRAEDKKWHENMDTSGWE